MSLAAAGLDGNGLDESIPNLLSATRQRRRGELIRVRDFITFASGYAIGSTSSAGLHRVLTSDHGQALSGDLTVEGPHRLNRRPSSAHVY